VLLYVGISLSAVARLAGHRSGGWSDRIARVEIEAFPTREAALRAESAAIAAEKPVFNKTMRAGGTVGAHADGERRPALSNAERQRRYVLKLKAAAAAASAERPGLEREQASLKRECTDLRREKVCLKAQLRERLRKLPAGGTLQ
jgi:hypothetical protein